MKLHIKVKFRALFITWGQTDEVINVPIINIPGFDKVLYDRKGVYLRLYS